MDMSLSKLQKTVKDRGAWRATVHGVAKNWTRLSDWTSKNWCFQIVVEKILESLLDSKEIKPINSKGNQPWIVIRRTDAEVEVPILGPPDVKSQLIGKDPDAGKDWGQEEKGETEDEIVGWHHQVNGHEFEQTPEDSEGQGSLACYSPYSHKHWDMTEQLNNNRSIKTL